MKMDIVESDLKQLFMWIKNLDELCKAQQALIETHHAEIELLEEHSLEHMQRIVNIERLLTQEDNK